MASRLDFRILGPLVVRVDGEPVAVGGPKQRALLALLLLSANRVVSRDLLIRELFADQGVNSADHALRNQVSRLRKVLTPDTADEPRLVARAPGYLLRVEPGELDLDRFEALAAEGSEALAGGDAATAAGTLRAAEALWSGRPLADLEFEPFARLDVERLEELRLAAVEERIDADLALGRHLVVVPELEALAAEHPYRERFRVQLMLALYRGGRQAEGLEVYRRTRDLLNDELGLEPGVELQQLERAILVQDPALELAPNGRETQAPPRPDVCPYKGLAPFEESDAEFFFGRERLVDELVGRLAEASLLAVVGPSGSGKSSLVQAGLVPALERETLVVRPSELTAAELSGAVAGAGPLVLAVDQFEELFADTVGAAERRAFVDVLVDLAWDPERRVLVLLALRADFFGRLAPYMALADLVGAGQVLLGPLTVGELRRAIEGPAGRTGLRVEPALVDALVDDVAGEAGALPLLSTALLDLWRERDGESLTLASYQRSGGVRGAVARHAEAAFRSLAPDDQPVTRRILVRLAAGGDGAPFTRRRASRAELDADDERVAGVLAALVEQRLLVAGDDHVELVHEALLERWPRLVEWLEEDAQGRRLHAHLANAAEEWDTAGRDPGELYRGARLAATAEWADAAGDDAGLNKVEREYLQASRTAYARAHRRLRIGLAAALVLLLLAIAAGAAALVARASARHQETLAVAERVGAQALAEPSLDRSLLLAREGVNLSDSEPTESNLLADLLRSPAAIGIVREGSDRLIDEALSPDGRVLAVRGDDGTVAFFDTRTFRQIGSSLAGSNQLALMGDLRGPVHSLAFTPNGSALAVGSTDGHFAAISLVARRTGVPVFTTQSGNLFAADIAVAPNGRTIATAEPENGFQSPPPTAIVVRNARTGATVATSAPIPDARLAGYTPDGRRLLVVTGAGTSLLLDARTLRSRRTLRTGGAAAVSPVRDQAVFGHDDGSLSLVDLRTGAARALDGRATAPIDTVAFSPDGATVATGADNGTVAIWDLRPGGLRETLSGHAGAVLDAVFSPDGRTLYTASSDGSAIAWDLGQSRRLGNAFQFTGADGQSSASDVSPDGTLIAVSPAPNRVTLWRAATLKPAGIELRGPFRNANSIVFSHDGKLLAATGSAQDGSAQTVVWNLASRSIVRTIRLGPHGSSDVAFSPDGGKVAIAEGDNAVLLVDLRTGKHVLLESQGPGDVDFSPDGKLVASAGLDGTVTIWNVAQGRVVHKLPDPTSAAFSVKFSPDGKLVAVGDSNGTVTLWDAATGKIDGAALGGHTSGVQNIDFDPSGRRLASAAFDGNLRLWDVASRKLIGAPLPSGTNNGGSVEFFPDGKHLLGAYGGGTAIVWNVDPAAWKARACSVANRSLSPAEWQEFLGGRAFRPVCP
jgi:WD40 repeat protein/DNA-binding SARP family transcriptional activator